MDAGEELVRAYVKWAANEVQAQELAGESWAPNLTTGAAHAQFRAETINGAVNAPNNVNLDNIDAVASYIWTNGAGLRAWGGGAGSNFEYSGNGLDIDITADHELALMSLGEDSNWGRCAHELGHIFDLLI